MYRGRHRIHRSSDPSKVPIRVNMRGRWRVTMGWNPKTRQWEEREYNPKGQDVFIELED